MITTFIFLVWFTINVVFLSNFHLPGGYLAIVNFAFMGSALLIPKHAYEDD